MGNWLTPKLQGIIHPSKTVLDLGCGIMGVTDLIVCKYRVGVDICPEYLKIANYWLAVIRLDLSDFDSYLAFVDKSFDVVLAIDFIEHLTKERGNDLVDMMERVAREKVIVFTPNGFVEQKDGEGSWAKGRPDIQSHKSGWAREEFEKRGYVVEILPDKNHNHIFAVKDFA